MPSPGSIKARIASMEKRISHEQAEDHVRKTGQHRYRATVNYWKDMNNSEQFGPPPGSPSSHSSSLSMDSSSASRSHRQSREIMDSSLQRLANERRSVRESRQSRAMANATPRMRRSTDELDRVGQGNTSARASVDASSTTRHSRDPIVVADQTRHSSYDEQGTHHSRENSLDTTQGRQSSHSSVHSRENSMEMHHSSRENSSVDLQGKTSMLFTCKEIVTLIGIVILCYRYLLYIVSSRERS